jgi:hypothetical protein
MQHVDKVNITMKKDTIIRMFGRERGNGKYKRGNKKTKKAEI